MSWGLWLRFVWSLISLAVLFIGLAKYNPDHAETGVWVVIGMGLLAFPSSVLSYLLLYFVTEVVGFEGFGRFNMFIYWLVFFVFGFLQWFVAVPRMWRRRLGRERS